MKSYKLQSVTILERGDGHIEKTATYRAVILSEDNEMWVTRGYMRSLEKLCVVSFAVFYR